MENKEQWDYLKHRLTVHLANSEEIKTNVISIKGGFKFLKVLELTNSIPPNHLTLGENGNIFISMQKPETTSSCYLEVEITGLNDAIIYFEMPADYKGKK